MKMNAAGVCCPSSYIKGIMSKHIYLRFIWIHNTDYKKVNLYKLYIKPLFCMRGFGDRFTKI